MVVRAAAREVCEDARHGEGRHSGERGGGVVADTNAGACAGTGRDDSWIDDCRSGCSGTRHCDADEHGDPDDAASAAAGLCSARGLHDAASGADHFQFHGGPASAASLADPS